MILLQTWLQEMQPITFQIFSYEKLYKIFSVDPLLRTQENSSVQDVESTRFSTASPHPVVIFPYVFIFSTLTTN